MRFKKNKYITHLILYSYIFLLLICFPKFASSAVKAKEYTLKALFIERFTRFIDWPKDSNVYDTTEPFILAVIGENPFGPTLDMFYSTMKIKDKKVKIHYIKKVADIDPCHLLFIANTTDDNLAEILSYISKKPILTFSDSESFVQKGVHINLFFFGKTIQYAINLNTARKAGFHLSHLLLKQAKEVVNGKGN